MLAICKHCAPTHPHTHTHACLPYANTVHPPIHTHTNTHTCMLAIRTVHPPIHTHTNIHTHMHARHTQTLCTHPSTHTHTHTRTRTCTLAIRKHCAPTHTHPHTHTHAHAHARLPYANTVHPPIHKHTHTHACHTHTPCCASSRLLPVRNERGHGAHHVRKHRRAQDHDEGGNNFLFDAHGCNVTVAHSCHRAHCPVDGGDVPEYKRGTVQVVSVCACVYMCAYECVSARVYVHACMCSVGGNHKSTGSCNSDQGLNLIFLHTFDWHVSSVQETTLHMIVHASTNITLAGTLKKPSLVKRENDY